LFLPQNPPLVADPVIVVSSLPIWILAAALPPSDPPERT
jgi:hypothetical protein